MSIYYNLSSTTDITDEDERPLTITNFSTKKTIDKMSDYSVGVKRFKIPVETVPFYRIYENRLHLGYSSSNNQAYKSDASNTVRNTTVDVFGNYKNAITDDNAFVPFTSGIYNDFYVDKAYKEPTTTDATDTTIGNRFLPIKDNDEFCSIMTRALNHSIYAGIPAKATDNLGYIQRTNIQTAAVNVAGSASPLATKGVLWKAINTLAASGSDLLANVVDYRISITDFTGSDYAKFSDLAFRLRINYNNTSTAFVNLGGGFFNEGTEFDLASFGLTPTSASKTRGDGFINWSAYARYSSNYLKGDALDRGFNKVGMCVYPASNEDLDNLLGRNIFGDTSTTTGTNVGTITLEARLLNSKATLSAVPADVMYNISSTLTMYGATTYTTLRQNNAQYRSQIFSSPRFNFNEQLQKIELRSHAIDNDETTAELSFADQNSNLFDSRGDLFMNNRLINILGFSSTSKIASSDRYLHYFQKPPKNATPSSLDFGGMIELENLFNNSTNGDLNAFLDVSTNEISKFDVATGKMTKAVPTYMVWREKELSIFKRNFLWGLEMITNRLPIEGEVVGDGNEQKKILTDFVADPSSVVRDYLLYQPEGNAVRYYPLNSDQPLDSVDITVNYTDINAITRPLLIKEGTSASIKLEFRPTNMINNYSN